MHLFLQFVFPFLLFIFILYRKIKQSIGFQLLHIRRLKIRIILFIFFSGIIIAASALHPISYLYDVIGGGVGYILAKNAIQYSLFEIRQEALYFRTNIWIESLILFLFFSRFLYQIIIYLNTLHSFSFQDPMTYTQDFTNDPLTRAVFLILSVYYIGYYIYLLRKGKEMEESKNSGLPQ